jgi:hypothetical protein
MALGEEIEKGELIIIDKKEVEYVMAPSAVMHGSKDL